VVGVSERLMEAMAGGVHAREPGATPERSRVLRPRRQAQVADLSESEFDVEGEEAPEADGVVDDMVHAVDEDDALIVDEEAAAVDKDREWHAKCGLQFVATGGVFELGGVEFERGDGRAATCRNCDHFFNVHSYNLRALGAHAFVCAAKEERRISIAARATDEWTGTLASETHVFDMGFGASVTVTCVFSTVPRKTPGFRGFE
jgi:hypothetical protein